MSPDCGQEPVLVARKIKFHIQSPALLLADCVPPSNFSVFFDKIFLALHVDYDEDGVSVAISLTIFKT